MGSRPPPSLLSVSSFLHGLSTRPPHRNSSASPSPSCLSAFYPWSCREHAGSLAAAASTSEFAGRRRPSSPASGTATLWIASKREDNDDRAAIDCPGVSDATPTDYLQVR